MKRKYGSFLNSGRLTDCIKWIETAIDSAKPIQRPNSYKTFGEEFTGKPLQHNWSVPPRPIKNPSSNLML